MQSTRDLRSWQKYVEALLWRSLARTSGGGPPGSGNESAFAVPFNFATPSPLLIHALLPGAIVSRVAILIHTPFDGAGAQLSLGTPFSPALFLGPGDNTPSIAAQYGNDAVLTFAIPDTMQLVIVPGAGATQGAGIVFANIKL